MTTQRPTPKNPIFQPSGTLVLVSWLDASFDLEPSPETLLDWETTGGSILQTVGWVSFHNQYGICLYSEKLPDDHDNRGFTMIPKPIIIAIEVLREFDIEE